MTKTAATIVKQSKEKSWEEFGQKLDTDYRLANYTFIVIVLKGIHSRSDKNITGAESSSFYYPRLLHCLNQMLAVVLLSQHQVLSSKTVRPHAPCGA